MVLQPLSAGWDTWGLCQRLSLCGWAQSRLTLPRHAQHVRLEPEARHPHPIQARPGHCAALVACFVVPCCLQTAARPRASKGDPSPFSRQRTDRGPERSRARTRPPGDAFGPCVCCGTPKGEEKHLVSWKGQLRRVVTVCFWSFPC